MARIPAIFSKIQAHVLGSRYDLSVAFLSDKEMRQKMKYRYKRIAGKKTSNVLSFELSKTSGEILICPSAARPYSLAYLFIHGCLHLKGRKHSDTMEREENRILKKFGLRAHE
ncbi:MAG TPA: rRNA maturation RNAse YbeY [Candidatus Paceibacterota bacterium]|nr:rRNA maturation RNAse YbeY [Candidatus Paceibacterota bacterium]